MKEIATKLEIAYLDFFNDYLTIQKFADDNGLTEFEARTIVNAGRKIHENKFL